MLFVIINVFMIIDPTIVSVFDVVLESALDSALDSVLGETFDYPLVFSLDSATSIVRYILSYSIQV